MFVRGVEVWLPEDVLQPQYKDICVVGKFLLVKKKTVCPSKSLLTKINLNVLWSRISASNDVSRPDQGTLCPTQKE